MRSSSGSRSQWVRRQVATLIRRYSLRRARLAALSLLEHRKLRQREFAAIAARYGNDLASRARELSSHYYCRPFVDAPLIRIVQRLKRDFALTQFVETGTYNGDTSLFFSLLFEHVFTCDVIDHPRHVEFYLRDNVHYETKSSPEFLRQNMDRIAAHSLFWLDAHWEEEWPLRDELQIIFSSCQEPVIIVDDYNAGHGLEFDTYRDQPLDANYIADLVPRDYKFFVNTWSHRNRGMLFLVPPRAAYGCPFSERQHYREAEHGLWEKI